MSVEPALPREAQPAGPPPDRPGARPRRRTATDVRPELIWPGKHSAAVVPLRPLEPLAAAATSAKWELRPVTQVGADHSNMMIIGDAAAVLPLLASGTDASDSYRGTVKLAYLDPPFNTGSRFEHYADSLDSAAWLQSLQQRLLDVRSLLHPQGSVWLHLDDSEQHHGRCLLDEVFGADAFVATIVWQRRTSRDNRKAFSASHDYVHVYSPAGPRVWKTVRNGLPDDGALANPDDDPRGSWRSVPMSAQAGHGTASQFYTVVSPAGVAHDPPPGRCWTYTLPRFQELVAAGRVYWPRGGAGRPRLKRYASEIGDLAPFTLWMADDVGDNAESKKELLRLIDDHVPFDTPKPERLMQRIIHIATDPGDIVLDCYLGSGTTAAVAHKMERDWIGIEALAPTVQRIADRRLQAVVAGLDPAGVTAATGWRGGGGYRILQAYGTTSSPRLSQPS